MNRTESGSGAPEALPTRPADAALSGAAAYVAATHAREAEAATLAHPPHVAPQADAPENSGAAMLDSPAGAAAAAATPAPYLTLEDLARVPSHARDHEGGAPEPLRQAITDALRSVYDPEIPVNIYDIGLIYEIEIDAEKRVKITMTLTSPTCPAAESLPPEVQAKVASVDGVEQVDIDLVWEPGWTPVMMSEDARLILNVM